VVATARKVESLEGLNVSMKLPLDVTSGESITRAVNSTLQQFGRIDVLVNNAGYAVRGAVEEVPVQEADRMFDVNLFGVMRMVQAAAPHMRKQASGQIINISSVSGKLVTPANGVYSASKFALEALSNALRLELEPFGIHVVIVEPGTIKTQFHNKVEASGQSIFANSASPYQPLYQKYLVVNENMRKQEPGPEVVSKVVQHVIETAHPVARYVAGFPYPGKLVLRLGDPAWDLVVKQLFNI
jgi:NAD(P)-dependent dehydrogenase (short-subunit alcohol dehydrogenase family)